VAAVHVAENNPQAILGVLGSDHDRVPISGKRNRLQAAVMRVHAFEISGADAAAERLISDGYAKFGASSLYAQLNSTGLAPRLRKKHLRQGKVLRTILALIVLGILGGIVAAVVAAVLPDGEARGSIAAYGGVTGGWNVALDFCAINTVHAPNRGIDVTAGDYPGYGLSLIGDFAFDPPWTLYVLSPQLPGGVSVLSPASCSVFNAQVARISMPNAGSGSLMADCTLPTGERVIVQTSFNSCE
jgi:hypothetical protein